MSAEVSITEFPFVAEMPKRQKTKLASLWDELQEMRAVVQKDGVLLPMWLAAEAMNISRQRVDQLMELGKLKSMEFAGKRWVLQSSVEEWAREEHKAGRPLKQLEGISGAVAAAKAYRADAKKKK